MPNYCGNRARSQAREWISSLDATETGAPRFAGLSRGHWNIENGSHRQRDTLWREDHQRMKHHGRAHILATLRQLALWLHRCGGILPADIPTSHTMKRFSHNPGSAIPLITRDPRE